MIVLQPVLRRFLDRYPEIRVDLCIDNSLVDMAIDLKTSLRYRGHNAHQGKSGANQMFYFHY